MGHTSCFSSPSNYSLQAGNWHPSPSISALHTQSQVGWEATLTLQTWAQASFLFPGAPPATIHSVPTPPPIIPPRACFLVLGVPTPAIQSVLPPPATDRSPRGCRPHPTWVQPSLHEPWAVFPVEGHSFPQQVPTKGTTELGSWTQGMHSLVTSDEDTWSQWRRCRHRLLPPSLV